jgi:mutator protein MutT
MVAIHLPAMPADTIRVIAAVISDADRLLVCQRPPHKRHGGLWEFPGGKCEPGESDFEAASRELREELGVEVISVGPELTAIHDPGSPFLIAFVPATMVGTPVCHEHTALRWGTLEELVDLALAPSDRRFVEARLAGKAG